MISTLSEDVFAYMGPPVSQHRPVFNKEQIQGMFHEAFEKIQK